MEEWAQTVTGSCGAGGEDPVLVEEGVPDDMGAPIDPANVGQGHGEGVWAFLENRRAAAALDSFSLCNESG